MTFFLGDQQEEQIGLTYVLSQLSLETEYGRECRDRLQPVPPESLEVLTDAWEDIDRYLTEHREHPAVLKELRKMLHGMHNIRGSIHTAASGKTLTDVDLYEIKKQAFAMERIRRHLKTHRRLAVREVELHSLRWLTELLDPEETGIETFYLYDAYDEELAEIRKQKRKVEEQIHQRQNQMKKTCKNIPGAQVLWTGEVLVPRTQLSVCEQVEQLGTYRQTGETGEDLIYQPKPLKEQEELEELLMKEEKTENQVRIWISQRIGSAFDELRANTEAVAKLDLLLGKTLLAVKHRACRPTLSHKREINIQEGRHPLLEDDLRKDRRSIVPVDIHLQQGATVITGANMGGKTLSLKMVALLTVMAQMGFWVPAGSFDFSPVAHLYFSSGDPQSQAKGLSTFGGEIHGIIRVLQHAHREGLILLDELAGGTNPQEGSSLSRAIVSHLSRKPGISAVTTHYDGVADLQGVVHYQVAGLNREMIGKLKKDMREKGWKPGLLDGVMDYRLLRRKPGSPVSRDAIAVAEIMGLPEPILLEARRILGSEKGK